MLTINKVQKKDFSFYEAIFSGGNLYAFTLSELLQQLKDLHGLSVPLFEFSLN